MLNVCKVSFGNYSIGFEKTYVMVLKFNFEVQFMKFNFEVQFLRLIL